MHTYMPNKNTSVQEQVKYISTIRMVIYEPCFQLDNWNKRQTYKLQQKYTYKLKLLSIKYKLFHFSLLPFQRKVKDQIKHNRTHFELSFPMTRPTKLFGFKRHNTFEHYIKVNGKQ